MISFLIYLAKVNIVFILLYVIYYLFFKRLTFHNLNRGYLMLIIPISFVFPLMELSYAMPMVVQRIVPEFDEFIPTGVAQTHATLVESHSINYNLIFTSSICFSFADFCLETCSEQYQDIAYQTKIRDAHKIGSFWVVKADVPAVFSYFKWIFVPIKD
jgi:hypothetical protein